MNLKFVWVNDAEFENLSEILRKGFKLFESNDFNPEWIREEECLKLKSTCDIFVCDPFSGTAFEHLKKLKCRIFGPAYVLHCFQKKEILPKKLHYPAFTATMKGLVISCTNIDKKQRNDLHEKIMLMGGEASANLVDTITHLVAGEVGSKKYHVACALKKPVMLPEWIQQCWEIGRTNINIHASDSCFDSYRCPIFKGLHITVTQIDYDERKQVQKIVQNNGGKYSGELRANETTHLIAKHPEGQKYISAQLWKVNCVTPSWLYDCVKEGYCLDEVLYSVEESKRLNTTIASLVLDKKTRNKNADVSTISNMTITSHINETIACTSFICQKSDTSSLGVSALDNLNISSVKKTNFLDGCKIFISGFSGTALEKIRKIINLGEGTRYNQLSEIISHVIMKEKNKELLQEIEDKKVHPFVVSVDWLLKSFQSGKRADESEFILWEIPHVEQTPIKTSNVGKFKVHEEKQIPSSSNLDLDEDIIKQYMENFDENQNADFLELNDALQGNDAPEIAVISQPAESLKEDQPNVDLDKNEILHVDSHSETLHRQNESLDKNDDNKCEEPLVNTDSSKKEVFDGEKASTSHSSNSELDGTENDPIDEAGLFSNLIFQIIGFDDNDCKIIEEMLVENGGTISECESELNFVVVPLIGNLEHDTTTEVVTNCWVQMCLENSELLDISSNELFKPLNFDIELKPLEDCVLSISQYVGTERDCLICLAEFLGAKYQEYFVRKANSNSELVPSTHLVCKYPEGSKYKGACNWHLPAVTKEWLITCALSGVRVPEEKYLVKNVQKYDNSTKSSVPSVPDVNLNEKEPSKTLENEQNINCNINPSEVDKSEVMPKKLAPNQEPVNSSQSIQISGSSNTDIRKKRGNYADLKHILTPITPKPQISRIKELIHSERNVPISSAEKVKLDTPGKFLNPNVPFKPHYDFSDLMEMLDSPASQLKQSRKSISVEDYMEVHLQEAITQFKDKEKNNNYPKLSCSKSSDDSKSKQVMYNVTVCVSTKLRAKQRELNSMVASLGGEFRSTYDKSCTHFVYQGKLTDSNRELKTAREHNKIIVHPEWIYKCYNENIRVDEDLYPCTYNSSMMLNLKCPEETPQKIPKSSKKKQKDPSTKFSLKSKTDGLVNIEDRKIETDDNEASEVRDTVNRQIEIMLATKVECDKKKKQLSSPSLNLSSEGCRTLMSKTKASGENEFVPDVAVSQNVVVVWDDPMRRMEREKIAEHLTKESQPVDFENSSMGKIEIKGMASDSNKENDIIITPLIRTSPDLNKMKTVKPLPKFMFSGMSTQDRTNYSSLIESLGGEVSTSQAFDSSCTHLIALQPSRNEKFLSCMASGKWILHKSYLEECQQEQRFVDEEPHEWGNTGMKSLCNTLNPLLMKIAKSACHWRKKLQSIDGSERIAKAFEGWKAIVYTDINRTSSFHRLLEAGGAALVKAEFPFTDSKGATHAFLELTKAPSPEVDLKSLVEAGIHCVKPEYIAAYLTDDPLPTVKEFNIPEVLPFLNSDNTESFLGKRKADVKHNQSKRSKK